LASKHKSDREPKSAQSQQIALAEYVQTMKTESDRGCLLVGLSEIDSQLGEILDLYLSRHGAHEDAEWLLNPKAGNRPLGTLAIRTRMARCLNQITDEARDVIDAIRNIRNTHAHGTAVFEITAAVIADVMNAWSDTNRELVVGLALKADIKANNARRNLQMSVALVLLILAGFKKRLRDDIIGVEGLAGIESANEENDSSVQS
jgi:hypothetical protein